MIAASLALSAVASGLLLTAGYVTGARRTGRERERLRRELADRDAQLGALAAVQELLAAVRTPQRIGHAMTRLTDLAGGRAGLPRVLDAVAESGAFAAALLTDDNGLLVASSTQARNADQLSGIASLVLTLGERIVAHDQPAPLTVLVRDESGGLTLHRIFRLPFTEERYILTAVTRGSIATPDTLDPALIPLEALLAPR